MVIYGPRVNVHPDRYGANRQWQTPMIKWLILHTSEQSGAEDVNDAEDLARYMESPGDRPSSGGGFYGASYHGVTDTDRILPATEDHLVAYSAGGANQHGLHLCIPVRIRDRSITDPDANDSRAEWLDAGSRVYIRQAAEWIVDKARQYKIPLRRITPSEMAAGAFGYCDHHCASLAFRKSDHTDVGLHFPWDVLAADIDQIVNGAPGTGWKEGEAMGLHTKNPKQAIADTRSGLNVPKARLEGGQVLRVGIPAGPDGNAAHSAIVNVAIINPTTGGHLQVEGDQFADGSDGNFPAGGVHSWGTLAAVGDDGQIGVKITGPAGQRLQADVKITLMGVVT